MSEKTIPNGLEYYTADRIAESFDYWSHMPSEEASSLYSKLWDFVSESKNPTPMGGDGSNGTVETPGELLDLDNDDKAGHWWHRLTEKEQAAIVQSMDD